MIPFTSLLPPTNSNPPQPNPLSYQWLTALALTKTPACGSMVYFLWMKGPNESAFLTQPGLWEEAAGYLVNSFQTSVFSIHVLSKIKNMNESKKKTKRKTMNRIKNIDKKVAQEDDVWRMLWKAWECIPTSVLPHHLRLLFLWTVGRDKGGIEADVRVKGQKGDIWSTVLGSLSQTCSYQIHLMDNSVSCVEHSEPIRMCIFSGLLTIAHLSFTALRVTTAQTACK